MGDRALTVNAGIVGNFNIELFEKGKGSPLVFLHGFVGTEWNDCLEQLSKDFHVLAPRTPGFGESTDTDDLTELHDLLYVFLDTLDALGVKNAPLVGHSLGGMFAAELAAMQPERFSHLVLLSPFGLFEVDDPVPDFFTFRPAELAKALYSDPNSEQAKSQHSGPGALTSDPDPDQLIDFQIERAKALGQTAKWLWPIPDRGLNRRLHRIQCPTLILWGEKDGIVPPSYAERFHAHIKNSTVETVADAAHQIPVDQPKAVADRIKAFVKPKKAAKK